MPLQIVRNDMKKLFRMRTIWLCPWRRIREGHALLHSRGIRTTLEWNSGNHFKDAGIRTAKAFAWVMGS